MNFTLDEFIKSPLDLNKEISINILGNYSKKLFLNFIEKIRSFNEGTVNLNLSDLDMSNYKELKFSDKTSFHLCRSLKSVVLPKNLKKIPGGWLSRCYCLKKVEIPNKEMIIGEAAFLDCRELVEVNLSKKIEKRAFSGCEKLSVTVTECTELIGENAFEFIQNVKSANSLYKVKDGIVLKENELISSYGYDVKIPEEIRIIPNGFFAGPTERLRRVELHNGIKVIGKQAFSFQGIDSINLPDLEFIGEMAFFHSSVKSAFLGNKIKIIPKKLFWQCANLKSVVLPDNLEVIEEGAFCRSGIEEINFPAALRKIGKMAFFDCKNLKSVRLSRKTKVAKDAFDKTIFPDLNEESIDVSRTLNMTER